MVVGSVCAEDQQEGGPKFEPLYNGTDLSGWVVKDGKIESWKADGELLSCVTGGGGVSDRGDVAVYLWEGPDGGRILDRDRKKGEQLGKACTGS